MPPERIDEMDCRAKRHEGRSEAIRLVVELGLKASDNDVAAGGQGHDVCLPKPRAKIVYTGRDGIML
jgi:hypothetical protein